MSSTAIEVNGVSKLYRIGERQPYRTLRDVLAEVAAAPFRLLSKSRHAEVSDEDTIWALRDVSFSIESGEVIGIIGRNGAGKSTLLKLLSRITEPTAGSVEIRGRVGSLLEVGTGFHGELTGRENIYLNGAILGMKKAEIDRKFDEIVAFAEVEKFIDTPVKHYSSGMQMRLAFAVAAHLEPEILIVDEVLAVGDASFQKKCLKKMEDVGGKGRTVLFVSHSMPAITRLCRRVLLLDQGRLSADGPAGEVVGAYLRSGLGLGPIREWRDPSRCPGGAIARLAAVRVRASNGRLAATVNIHEPVVVEMEYDVLQPGYVLLPNFEFRNQLGDVIFSSLDIDPAWRRRPRPVGRYISAVEIPGNLFAEGTIVVGAGCETVEPTIFQFYEADAVAFQVIDHLHPDSARGDFKGKIAGIVRPRLSWRTQFSPTPKTA